MATNVTNSNQFEKKKPNGFIRFCKSMLPWKGDKWTEVVRKIVMLIAIIVFVASAVVLLNKFYKTYENQRMQQGLVDMTKDDELTWDKVRAMYPDIDFPEGMQLKYALLYAKNQDLVGWLEVADSSVAVPIVQQKNNDYYLHRDFYKKTTSYGNPFLDYRNNAKDLDFNNIIYGHNMKDKQIFGQLLDMYKTAENYKNYPIIQYNTIFKDYQWAVVGAFYSNGSPGQDNGYVFPFNTPDFNDLVKKQELLNELNKRFIYTTGAKMTIDDKLIMLTTCAYDFSDARFVIVARLLHDGEKVNVNEVQNNPNPRYPAAWYSKKRIKNTYANDTNWYAD